MKIENIATCKSAIWNSAMHKKIVTRKKIQHETCAIWRKCNMEKVQRLNTATKKSATWKECKMKQHERSETQKSATWKKL